ncbi:MAG: SCO family protein [Deltaproteobacteria bacterium]
MAPHRRPAILLGFLALLGASPAVAQTTDLLKREVAAIGVVEKLGATVPRGATFTDSGGNPVRFSDLSGKPLLLSFNYTSCPRLCGLQLHGMARALRDAGWDGAAFGVVSVSIDPEETQEQLARTRQQLTHEAGGSPGVEAGWRFLRGDKADVDALADAVGFKYRFDPATGEFAHQATLVVLTADGRVSGYLHGITYPATALRTALDRAGSGAVATAEQQRSIGGFLLTCMGFDPADPAPLALKVMRTGGVLAMAFLLVFLGTLAYRDVKRRRTENLTT